jgi:predicted aspartyl protease
MDLTRWGDVEVLVDSGALFTSIPRSTLEKLGLKPIAGRSLEPTYLRD